MKTPPSEWQTFFYTRVIRTMIVLGYCFVTGFLIHETIHSPSGFCNRSFINGEACMLMVMFVAIIVIALALNAYHYVMKPTHLFNEIEP